MIPAIATASFLFSVLGEGSFLSLLSFIERTPSAVATMLCVTAESTLTGPLQNEQSTNPIPTLTDAIKTFIVRGLARSDAPLRWRKR